MMSWSPPRKPAQRLLFPDFREASKSGPVAGCRPSTSYYLQLQRCHQIPPKGASSPQETMSSSSKTQPGLCCCGTGRRDKISQAQRSFVSADASGMFLFGGPCRVRGSRLRNTMFIEICFHLRNPRVAPAWRCILSAAEPS